MTDETEAIEALEKLIADDGRMELADVVDCRRKITAALKQQQVPEGWKLVPVELTDDMCEAIARNKHHRIRNPENNTGLIQAIHDDWKTALDAAPELVYD